MRALAASLALASVAAAQDPAALGPEIFHASIWTIANGLPQGSINDLLQTSDGALWIATFGGLLRFDGIEFKVYDLENVPGMPSNRVTALAPEEQGGLWLALQSGYVVRFRDGQALALETLPAPHSEPVALLAPPDGSLWVQGLAGEVLRLAAGHWSLLAPSGSVGSYEGLCLNRDGSVSAAEGFELLTFEPDGSERERLRAPARICSLATGDDVGPWVGLQDGLAHQGAEGIERIPMTLPPGVSIQCILGSANGRLWLGSSIGPVCVSERGSPVRDVQVEANEPLPEFDVRSMMRDHEGNIWVGADGVGLIRLRPRKLESFGSAEWRSGVNALADDGEGGAWVGKECKGLFHIAEGRAQPEPVQLPAQPGHGDCIEALLRDEAGRIWVGAGGRLLRLDLHVSTEFLPVLEALRLVGQIGPLARAAGGEVWISTLHGHLARVGPDDRVLEELDVPGAVYSLAVAPDGSLWIGGDGTLLHWARGVLESHGAQSGLPRGGLRDVLPEADGGVWVASYGGGVGYWKDGRGRTLSRANGLPDNSLSAIRDDGRGRLWILSNLGLIVAAREELLDVAAGRRARLDPVVLGPEAGMPESEYGAPTSMRDTLGRYWFGTIAGPVRVDPQAFPFNLTPTEVRIERLRADERVLPLSGRVEIPALTRRLVLDYTAFSLTAPERTHFRYRLDGFDEHWIEAGPQRWVAFTALDPGNYTFHVSARNEDGVWSERPAALAFEVLPAWWQTWAFRGAAVLAAAALLALAHRRRVAVIRRRAQTLLEATEGRARAETRESRLREELAHAGRVATAGELASSLAHEVNQPLAAIVTNAQAGRRFLAREPFSREELDEVLCDIAQQGQRASEVIRRLREFLRKNEAQRLPVDVNAVVRETLPLVRREIEDHGVQTLLALEDGLPRVLADPVQLQQVLVNLVKNACEALEGQAGSRSIEISSRRYDGRVLLDVRDNGPGLAPEVLGRLFQPYVTTKSHGMGLGLAICRSIIEAHGGRLAADARAGGGVAFRIDLPCGAGDGA
jgi:signal transduction histidine kinase/ligand-binding sensor domain-containing protein